MCKTFLFLIYHTSSVVTLVIVFVAQLFRRRPLLSIDEASDFTEISRSTIQICIVPKYDLRWFKHAFRSNMQEHKRGWGWWICLKRTSTPKRVKYQFVAFNMLAKITFIFEIIHKLIVIHSSKIGENLLSDGKITTEIWLV